MKHTFKLILLVTIVCLGALGFWKMKSYTEPAPSSKTDTGTLIFEKGKVLGYQLSPNHKEVTFLVNENNSFAVYKWHSETQETTKLSQDGNQMSNKVEENPELAKSFVDENNNIFFEIGTNLFKVQNNSKYKIYTMIDDNAINNGGTEVDTQRSLMFKQLAAKYAKTAPEGFQIQFSDENPIYYHLFEIDKNYYIANFENKLTFHRLPLQNEMESSILANSYSQITYEPKWNSFTNQLDEKGKIAMINDSILETNLKSLKNREVKMLVSLPTDKNYPINNDKYKANFYLKCYPNFMAIDGPLCRETRLFLMKNNKQILLSNGGLNKDSGKYEDGIVYFPSDDSFVTENGQFIFLSQDYKLYKY